MKKARRLPKKETAGLWLGSGKAFLQRGHGLARGELARLHSVAQGAGFLPPGIRKSRGGEQVGLGKVCLEDPHFALGGVKRRAVRRPEGTGNGQFLLYFVREQLLKQHPAQLDAGLAVGTLGVVDREQCRLVGKRFA